MPSTHRRRWGRWRRAGTTRWPLGRARQSRSQPEERDEGCEGGAGDEAGPPVDGLGEAETELERDSEQDRQHGEALLVEQLLRVVPLLFDLCHAGWSVPAKTCHASADFAVGDSM